MSLADYIEANFLELIDDWVEYARQITLKDNSLSEEQLRNSAADLLSGIVADMRTSQSAEEQKAKSRGDGFGLQSGFDDAAHHHADARLAHGFDINQVVAEFRALRATVLRRWQGRSPDVAAGFEDMIRFNEAIDQMLAESVRRHAQRTTRIRDLFSGVLAHDLRSPLGAILNSAELLLHDEGLSATSVKGVANIQRGSRRMKRMIDDLLVFSRTRLEEALPVTFTPQDMGRICSDAVDEVRASWPDAHIRLWLNGDLRGAWDGGRLGQLVTNLLVNAVRYGNGAVSVNVAGGGGQVSVAVENEGDPIPAHALPTLFDPLTRASPPVRNGTAAGMGLGLYICRCIATAHRGTITVESTENGTRFCLSLPASAAGSG